MTETPVNRDIRAIIAKLRKRPCGFTVDSPEFDGFTAKQVSPILWYECERQEIFKAKLSHTKVRYYGRKEWADELMAKVNSPKYTAQQRAIVPRRQSPQYFKDRWATSKQIAKVLDTA